MACALVFALACGVAVPVPAHADVRKADVVYGQTVDARGLSVAQCPNIDAEYALVMDADGTVYFERNATSRTQIASITKVMTAIVALDAVASGAVSLDSTVTVSAAAAAVGESSAGLQEGDAMPLEVALKALLVPSGNDAAVAIAETVGGSEDAFVAAMNAKAAELGCTDTVFENPHGLDDGEFDGDLHSCAADVAKMARYAMRNETFRAIVGGGDTSIVVDRDDGTRATIELESTDELIDYYERPSASRRASPSARALRSPARRATEPELYAIVINSTSEAQRFADADDAVRMGLRAREGLSAGQQHADGLDDGGGPDSEVPVVAEVAHADWIDATVKATLSDPDASVRVFDLNGNVSQSLEFDELTGDVHAGDKVGTITFKQRNAIVATLDLVACEDVAAPNLFEGIGIWWDRLFRGLSGQPQIASAVTLNETPLVVDKTAVVG